MNIRNFFILFCLFISAICQAEEKLPIRLAVLAYGTVNWELYTIDQHKLADELNFDLIITPVANPQAAKIALKSGAVDMIVSDWIWVSKLRADGSDLSFFPYSTSSGALVIPGDSQIKSIVELTGTSLGIAGGELDKNWLFLQALANKKFDIELNEQLEKVFAAPPFLSKQLELQRVDSIMTYWHYAAKLEAKGFKTLLTGQQILGALGIETPLPSIGYVFNRNWAEKNRSAVSSFFKTTAQAKKLLCDSDTAWKNIENLTKADTQAQTILRQRYCDGRIRSWGKKEVDSAQQVFQLLHQLSQNRLTGKSDTLTENTFWFID